MRFWLLIGVVLSMVMVLGSGKSAAAAYDARSDVVAVTGGLVGATRDSGPDIRTFRAIPFAAPPLGDLRWQPPQPVPGWQGVRRAESFSPSCMQVQRSDYRALFYQASEPTSEDCLYLNVWTPARSANDRRPVMVFFYGGGNTSGSGSAPAASGVGLASKGAVVVTFNYRLGPFGWLAHPELSQASPDGVSGNYGLLDQTAVLKWVQANIAAFGGDPSNVTVYGPSAGAVDMTVLLVSPLARGLFQRAVLESLSMFPASAPNRTLQAAEQSGAAAGSLADLRGMTAPDVLKLEGSWGPIVDGYVLPDQVDALFASGRSVDVPLIAGWNSNEATPYPQFAFGSTAAEFRARAQRMYGDLADRALAVYPVTTDADAQRLSYQPMTDGFFGWQIYSLVRAHHAAGQAKTFVYHFTRTPPYYPDQHYLELDPPERFGAYHGSEQVYLYANLDALPRPYTSVDRALADAASWYLINFATTGDPNEGPHAGLPNWAPLAGPDGPVQYLSETISSGPVPNKAALDFFDQFYAGARGR